MDWKNLLANPGPDGHIVQLYQDADFYGEAISHFAAEGFVRGESIILVATEPNWQNISDRLKNKGFNIAELFDCGQLTLLNATIRCRSSCPAACGRNDIQAAGQRRHQQGSLWG